MDPISDHSLWFGFRKGEYERAKADLHMIMQEGLNSPLKLVDITNQELDNFDGIFLPGGHAPMVDLWQDASLGRILRYFHRTSKPTAVICHGPAGLLSAVEDCRWIYSGYRLTCYSNAEDFMNEVMWFGKLPWKLADRISEKGGIVHNKLPLMSNVIVDRELISGQNPSSANALGEKFVERLRALPKRPFDSYTVPPAVPSQVEPSEYKEKEKEKEEGLGRESIKSEPLAQQPLASQARPIQASLEIHSATATA